jgi:peroxin-12
MNTTNQPTNLSTHNATVPTTIGALLTEENTIDPLSHLPSFLELTFVDVARNSGRIALSAAWDVGIGYLKGVEERMKRMERMTKGRVTMLHASSSVEGLTAIRKLERIISASISQLRHWYYSRLRRTCHVLLRTVQNLGPELQALIMYAIDYHCMHHLAGSTGCEMVYGLKRSKIVKMPQPQLIVSNINGENKLLSSPVAQEQRYQSRVVELSKIDRTKSALLAALLPYWKERCDQLYTRLKEQTNTDDTNYNASYMNRNRSINTQSRRATLQKMKNRFMRLYPYFHMTHEGSIFLYQFAYLLGYTSYWSFSLHALGQILRRMTVADVQQQQQQHQQQKHQRLIQTSKGRGVPSPRTTPLTSASKQTQQISTATSSNPSIQTKVTIPNMIRGAIIFSLSYSILSGWYSHFQRELRLRRRRWITGERGESERQSTNEGDDSQQRVILPIPPPPLPPPKLLDENEQLSIDKWSCPLCHEPRINPTASTSGYVFCYKCLIMHLRRKGEYCPVTGIPCYESKVVRLYEPTSSSIVGRKR